MWRTVMLPIVVLCASLTVTAKDVECVLKHSATAALDSTGAVDVHVSEADSIPVRISGIGERRAVFNGTHGLALIKQDADAYYYLQDGVEGVIVWAYFRKTNTITYTKLRAFPVNGFPDSYLMIGKCK